MNCEQHPQRQTNFGFCTESKCNHQRFVCYNCMLHGLHYNHSHILIQDFINKDQYEIERVFGEHFQDQKVQENQQNNLGLSFKNKFNKFIDIFYKEQTDLFFREIESLKNDVVIKFNQLIDQNKELQNESNLDQLINDLKNILNQNSDQSQQNNFLKQFNNIKKKSKQVQKIDKQFVILIQNIKKSGEDYQKCIKEFLQNQKDHLSFMIQNYNKQEQEQYDQIYKYSNNNVIIRKNGSVECNQQ